MLLLLICSAYNNI